MKCVEIMLHDDGSYMVAECEPSEEMAAGEMEGGQTFASPEEACQAAIDMLQSEDGAPSDLEKSMQAGYDKAAGKKMAPATGNAGFGEDQNY